ncbi:RNA polymerase sigma factor [Bacteroidota bacterium]
MTDTDLLHKIKENNEKAIADFYKSCRNEFIAFAMKSFSVSFSVGKEIFQEAFLAMHKNICSGKLSTLNSSLKTYLFQIGKNLISNEMKRDARHAEISNLDTKTDNDPDALNSKEEKENVFANAVKSALQSLDEKCRQLLRLFYIEQKKYDELILILNYSSIDSLKTQKYKCFKKLESVVKTQYNKKDFF